MSTSFQIKKIEYNTILYLFSLLPISLIVGTAIVNTHVLLISIYFIFHIFKKKKLEFLRNKIFFIFILIWSLLILNSLFIANTYESLIRSFGFIRFIILIFAFKYFFENLDETFREKVLKTWFIIFCVVTIDIFIEFFYGSNIFGFKALYPGRIASFTGDELVIGNYYFGFVLFALSFCYKYNFKNYKIFFYIALLIFITTSFLIGERSNFVKVFLISLLFIFLIDKKYYIKKIFVILIFLTISTTITLNNEFFKSRFLNEIIIPFNEKGLSKFINDTKHGQHFLIAKNIFKENKIFGIGLKNFRNESKLIKYHSDETIAEGSTTHPHQIHYEFLSETGLIGYCIFSIFFIISILFGLKSYFTNKDPLLLSSTLFIFATAMPLIPSGSFFTSFGATIFWINYSFLLIKK